MTQRSRIVCICSLTASLLVTGLACTSTSDKIPASEIPGDPYFDLNRYFDEEAMRLQKLKPTIAKTVSKNDASESKSVQIEDWKDELGLFIDSDINKPAWRGRYRIDSTKHSLTYTSVDPELRTQQITIEKQIDGTIKHIAIVNRISNMLYQTEEQLDYYPDSLYRINRQQSVRVIGESQYAIVGISQR